MIRTELLEKLERVAPALSGNDLVPVLSHFWFRNNTLLAYNDLISISTKLTSSFEGAIPKTLVSLLTASRAKEVEFLPDENEIVIKAASSKVKLPFLSKEAMNIFEIPKPDSKQALPVDIDKFLTAIKSVMLSLKENISLPDSLGITLVFKNSGVDMFTTNDATISMAFVELNKIAFKSEQRMVLSGAFCRQMFSLAKLDGPKHLEIHDDYSLFVSEDTVLFGRFIDIPRPLDFHSVVDTAFPVAAHKNLVSIPSKLELILDRAVIITNSKIVPPTTEIEVESGIARFFSKSEKGEVQDMVRLEDEHKDVKLSIDPNLVNAGYGSFDKMLLTKRCFIMAKAPYFLYLVSASQ